MNQPKVYLDEFPVNEKGLLLVNDLALIEALRRRAKQQRAVKEVRADEPSLSAKPS